MPRTPDQLRLAAEMIGEAIFRSIDPAESYLVVAEGKGSEMTQQRLLAGLSNAFVLQKDGEPAPIRDFGIYRLTDTPEHHNDLLSGWADGLVDNGVAVQKLGADVTVFDIHACAKMEVLLRLQAEEEP